MYTFFSVPIVWRSSKEFFKIPLWVWEKPFHWLSSTQNYYVSSGRKHTHERWSRKFASSHFHNASFWAINMGVWCFTTFLPISCLISASQMHFDKERGINNSILHINRLGKETWSEFFKVSWGLVTDREVDEVPTGFKRHLGVLPLSWENKRILSSDMHLYANMTVYECQVHRCTDIGWIRDVWFIS